MGGLHSAVKEEKGWATLKSKKRQEKGGGDTFFERLHFKPQ